MCSGRNIAHLVRDPLDSYPIRKRSIRTFTDQLMNQNPGNYLRAHRKRSGLTQQDIAALLGSDAGTVSRFEWSHSLPSLPLALAFEVVFMVPVSQLFSGLREAVGHSIEQRLANLEAELGSRSGKGPRAVITAKKLEWIMERRRILTAV
jgi:transcriptional regulator with XRE-family HTH domain